jgi:transcriptional regulator of acetoin/glycerol metabolism
MDRYGGNVSHAANALGLSRGALYRRFKRHGM